MNQGNPDGMRSRGYDAAWWQAATRVASVSLSGLTIACPACHHEGVLFSKWQRGSGEKPLFVIHRNGGTSSEVCPVAAEDTLRARSQVRISAGDVRRAFRLGKPVVLFSGGRDSLCTLEYLRVLYRGQSDGLTALHINTTAGFPEVEEYVERVCEILGVRLVTVRPDRDFFDTAKRWGIPGVRSRWCCKTLKVMPATKYLRQLDGPVVVYDGIRAAESPVRAKYTPIWYHPSFRCLSISPIFSWTDAKVDDYIRLRGLPQSPVRDLGCSAECWCGAYKKRSDFEKLLQVHPEIFDRLVDVEKAQKGRYTFLYENGERVPLKSLRPTPARR